MLAGSGCPCPLTHARAGDAVYVAGDASALSRMGSGLPILPLPLHADDVGELLDRAG